MSYSQMLSGIIGQSAQVDQHQHVQRQLQSLVQQLSWSYVALWCSNHQTRKLECRGGYFMMSSTAVISYGDTEVWNEYLFNSTYKSCTITPGHGSVGVAFAEGRNIWMNGQSVTQSVGSKEQAQFLRHARIETAMCIPWSDGVLELGTCQTMSENFNLMEIIRKFFTENILSTLGHVSSVSPLRHVSDNLQNQDSFEPTSLNHQIRRSAGFLSSLNTDMFLQQPEDTDENAVGMYPDNIPRTNRSWRSPTTSRLPSPDAPLITLQGPAPAVMGYRSPSGTTSSSLSSLEDGSHARLSVDSPDQLMASNQRCNSHSNASSSPRSPQLNTPSGADSQRVQVEDDIQKVFSLMLDIEAGENAEEWRGHHVYGNPPDPESGNMGEVSQLNCSNLQVLRDEPHVQVLRDEPHVQAGAVQDQLPAFKSWRHSRVLVPRLEKTGGRTNQLLLRRVIDLMKQIDLGLKKGLSADGAGVGGEGSRSLPEAMPDNGFADYDPFDQVGPSRGQGQPRAGSRITSMAGPAHAGHSEAAMNHMMAERRRRVKQKENFSALRKLVPLISKADKASILGDAILYLKGLQKQIEEVEADRTETESRYQNLKACYKHLEQRNKELEVIAGLQPGVNNMHVSTGFHSMQSF